MNSNEVDAAVSLYVLMDPVTNEERYVGISVNPTERLGSHLRDKADCHRVHWIQSLLAAGLRPVLRVLAVLTLDEARRLEVLLIAKMRSHGQLLVNNTDGGEGVVGLSQGGRQAISQKAKIRNAGPGNPMYGRLGSDSPQYGAERSEEIRKKMRRAWIVRKIRGPAFSALARQRQREAQLGQPLTDEHREKLREAAQEVAARPGMREKRIAAARARWARPGEREKQAALARELNRYGGR